MDRKLIINIAPVGNLIVREQNPHIPYSPEEIAKEVIECYREGASIFHIHTRDERGFPDENPQTKKKVMDLIFDECPDMISSLHVIHDRTLDGLDQFKPLIDALHGFGQKYIRLAVTVLDSYTIGPGTVSVSIETASDLVRYLEGLGIKPEFQPFQPGTIQHLKDHILDKGVAKLKPYFININMGKHHSPTVNLDPWSYFDLISAFNQLPRDSVKGLSVGGRNWLPITVLAIMLGIDVVRIGMEDTLWMYPHKDEIIERNVDVVRKIVSIAEELGREIATPKAARKILGI
ncbi:MAG: 3-keto-5-aminohexanoate cleavage protein [Candidatus Geothermarchaeales archaeon]